MEMTNTQSHECLYLAIFHIFSYDLLHSDVWSASLLEVGQHE
jgi:hypothetical protein